ncbi:MAG: phenylalanine--tRNA ligase subunit beta, partial [Thiohalophilus sp.]
HTDSSHRFERGVDPALQVTALERATALLQAICGGEAGPVVHIQQADDMPVRDAVTLREARIGRVLGAEIATQDVSDILQRLGMQVESDGEGWQVTPPSFRFDINLEVDLIEELGRIHGYDNLPSSRPQISLRMSARPETHLPATHYKRLLVDLGYQEAITYSFVDPKLQDQVDPNGRAVMLANPLSADMAAMRTSLWPGLLQTAIHNLNRQQDRVLLFEQGLKFVVQDTELKQESVLAGLICGDLVPAQWGSAARPADFYDCKGHVEQLLAQTGRADQFRFEPDDSHSALHPGQAARISLQAETVGRLGALHPDLQQQLDLARRVYLFEISLSALSERRLPAYAPLSKYPSIRRDIAIVVDEDIAAQKVKDCIENAGSGLLKNIELFDVYVGEGIDSGRKSLALGLTLQDLSRTLKDTDVESEISRILKALNRELGATLRE